jgi:hypothetical protein
MKVIVARSGLAWIVSPPSSTPPPPAPAVQWATALPGKWPPNCHSVTPGTTSRVPDHVRIAGSGRATHF